MSAGRTCPLSYRYGPEVFNARANADTDTLYVVGGVYGNEAALDTVVEMFAAESGRKHLIFNGDFNWFNVGADSFGRINEKVLSFDATRGNVETELGPRTDADGDPGCGCGYPDWVEDAVVHRSNAIMARLAVTATRFPEIQRALAKLPMYKRIDVGGVPIGILHGDPESLSGWGFAAERLSDRAAQQQTRRWFDIAGVQVFACSHTCSPVFLTVRDSRERSCLVANNGAAGMPNFEGSLEGLLTRISIHPSKPGLALYAQRIGNIVVEALPIRFDRVKARQAFLRDWPPGSAAHDAYWRRITEGPSFALEQANPQHAC